MQSEPESPQPGHRTYEGRANGRLVALITLLVSVALLLSLGAAWVFIPIARVPAVCVFHHKSRWIILVDWSAFLLIPTAIISGLEVTSPMKKQYSVRLRRVGKLNIILAVLLILSLAGAEFLYFVCQL
jgi:hypothetical protein